MVPRGRRVYRRSMSKLAHAAFTVVVALSTAACGGDKDKAKGSGGSARASSEAAPSAQEKGAAGAGDKSGKDTANALALAKDKPASFDVECKGAVFVGPFTFRGDKDTIKVHGEAKSKKGDQSCVGGAWLDEKGEFIATAGIGCAEGDKATAGDTALEFDPKSGGNDHRTVFLKINLDETVCAPVSIKLTLP